MATIIPCQLQNFEMAENEVYVYKQLPKVVSGCFMSLQGFPYQNMSNKEHM